MRIYCDLDGVLVNLEKGYINKVNSVYPKFLDEIGYDGNFKNIDRLLTLHFEKLASNDKEKAKAKFRASAKFWSFIRGDENFWINLEWMPDGKELFNSLVTLRENNIISELSILSAPSKSDPIVPQGKRAWLSKNNVTSKVDNVIIDGDKFKYANDSNDILIDDTMKKLDAWKSANGTPIFHTNTSNTLSILNKILLNNR